MAKSLKADKSKKQGGKANGGAPGSAGKTAAPAVGHNARADVRASIQLTAFKKLWDLDREIAAVKAQEVKPRQEERGEVWKTLRNDLDAAAADLKPLYSLYKRDREVREFDDEEQARKSQDMLREGFETLQRGDTLDFLSVLGEPKQAKQPEGEPVSTKTARAAGRQAGQAGKPGSANPHGEGSDLHAAWNEGHLEGMKENLPTAGDPFATVN